MGGQSFGAALTLPSPGGRGALADALVRVVPCLLLTVATAHFASAEEAKPDDKAQPKVTYEEHVQAIFRQHCFTCHGADTAKSDLRLDNYAAMMRGGASGAVIEPGDVDGSRLWKLVSHEETPEMPPKQDKLPEATLATLKQWITLGALEKAGSTAKMKAKPKIEMKATAGAGKPEGPPPMPEGLSRQPSVYTARPAAVTALAVSPWAPLLAVAGQKQIVLYNTDTAQLLGVLPFPEGTPQVLRFSRSGTVLLAGGGRDGQSGRVVLFDVKSGSRITEIGDELDTVLAADINDDHTQVALGGPRRVVKIYNVADGGAAARNSQAYGMDHRDRIQPGRRTIDHGRPQRRHVRVGSRDGARVSELEGTHGLDHGRQLAD